MDSTHAFNFIAHQDRVRAKFRPDTGRRSWLTALPVSWVLNLAGTSAIAGTIEVPAVSDNNEGIVKVHLKWGPRFFIFGVLIDICLLMLMYWTHEKEVAFFCHKYLSYSGIWTGTRLFRGIPMTKTVLIFVDAYVVLFSGIQAFVVGLIIDLFREKSKIR